MTTGILKKYGVSSFECLELLIKGGLKTVSEAMEKERTTKRAKEIEISKIINILGSGALNERR